MTIENTRGKDLTNLKGIIKLPNGVYCKDPDALILSTDSNDNGDEENGNQEETDSNDEEDGTEEENPDEAGEAGDGENGSTDQGDDSILVNRAYDSDKKTMSFELSELKSQEKAELELYVYAEDFKGESKNFSFLYNIQAENTYNSNVVNLNVINTIRDVVA